jgi:hypothetical protein
MENINKIFEDLHHELITEKQAKELVILNFKALPSKEVVEPTDETKWTDEAIQHYWKRKNCFGHYLEGLVTGSIWMRDNHTPSVSIGDDINDILLQTEKEMNAAANNYQLNVVPNADKTALEFRQAIGTDLADFNSGAIWAFNSIREKIKTTSTPSKISIWEIEKKAEEFYKSRTGGLSVKVNPLIENRMPDIIADFAKSILASDAGWVSVEKEVPEYYKSVLAMSSNESQAVVHRVSDGDNQYYIITGTDEILKNVTHFKPLTNPTKQ